MTLSHNSKQNRNSPFFHMCILSVIDQTNHWSNWPGDSTVRNDCVSGVRQYRKSFEQKSRAYGTILEGYMTFLPFSCSVFLSDNLELQMTFDLLLIIQKGIQTKDLKMSLASESSKRSSGRRLATR